MPGHCQSIATVAGYTYLRTLSVTQFRYFHKPTLPKYAQKLEWVFCYNGIITTLAVAN